MIADPSPVFAYGLAMVLQAGGVDVAASVRTHAEAIATLNRSAVDVILVGLDPPDAMALAASVGGVPVLVLASSVTNELIADGLQAGARGFLRKDAAREELLSAVHVVSRGSLVLPQAGERMVFRFVDLSVRRVRPGDGDPLTAREREIVDWLVVGHSNKLVARELGIAEQTVKNHVRHIMAKVGVSSRVQLCRWALAGTAPAAVPDADGSHRSEPSPS